MGSVRIQPPISGRAAPHNGVSDGLAAAKYVGVRQFNEHMKDRGCDPRMTADDKIVGSVTERMEVGDEG